MKAEINWYNLFNEMIADFDLKAMKKRQTDILKRFDIKNLQ